MIKAYFCQTYEIVQVYRKIYSTVPSASFDYCFFHFHFHFNAVILLGCRPFVLTIRSRSTSFFWCFPLKLQYQSRPIGLAFTNCRHKLSIISKKREHSQYIDIILQSFLELLIFPSYSASRKHWSCSDMASTYSKPLL